MKISVLIAATEPRLPLVEALAGVRAQTHSDWELIVLDHGPPDGTEDVVRDFGVVVQRPALYARAPDTTTSPALRNQLLELATGDLVAFLDSSDHWTPRHLANAVQALAEGADVALSDLRFHEPDLARPPRDVATPAQLTSNPVRALFARDAIPVASTVVFRREAAARAGGFDPRFRAAEGRDFWLRCALQGSAFVATHRSTCQTAEPRKPDVARSLLIAEQAVLFYEKHRDLAVVPAALRRRLLAASLVTQGRLLRDSDPPRAARCFWRAWSLQPVHVQTLGQFALTGWRSSPQPPPEPRRPSSAIGNGSA